MTTLLEAINTILQTQPEPEAEWMPCLPVGSVRPVLRKLKAYVREHHYQGADPFDGLNSRLFRNTPLYDSELFRLALIQFCKKSPFNFRPLLSVPPGFNAKGGALFLMGHLNLLRHTGDKVHAREAKDLYLSLKHNMIRRAQGVGWGYNFDWQARAFYVSVGTPNLVTTVYTGRALLEYHRAFEDPRALQLALDAAGFILDEMIKFENEEHLCFNYIPGKDAEVHNANLLGAAYLAEVLEFLLPENREAVKAKILKSVRFSMADIQPDGAWPYGTKPFHRWVDNFHTAYNIECLVRIGQHLETEAFLPDVSRTLAYYLENLFTDEGLPKYYNNRLYPIDIHVIAQCIVLFNLLKQEEVPLGDSARLKRIEQSLFSLVYAFQDRKGFFYYQQTAYGWNRIPYMRWGQAWMFYALTTCLAPQTTSPTGFRTQSSSVAF